MQKRGFFYLQKTPELTWRVGPAHMQHGTQGHVPEPREPMRPSGGTEVARTHGRAT